MLITLAKQLADNLQECDHDVTYLDLLDCLASTGITLKAMGDTNEASNVYLEEIAKLNHH